MAPQWEHAAHIFEESNPGGGYSIPRFLLLDCSLVAMWERGHLSYQFDILTRVHQSAAFPIKKLFHGSICKHLRMLLVPVLPINNACSHNKGWYCTNQSCGNQVRSCAFIRFPNLLGCHDWSTLEQAGKVQCQSYMVVSDVMAGSRLVLMGLSWSYPTEGLILKGLAELI